MESSLLFTASPGQGFMVQYFDGQTASSTSSSTSVQQVFNGSNTQNNFSQTNSNFQATNYGANASIFSPSSIFGSSSGSFGSGIFSGSGSSGSSSGSSGSSSGFSGSSSGFSGSSSGFSGSSSGFSGSSSGFSGSNSAQQNQLYLANIDKWIQSGEISEITKLIQQIITSNNINCDAKTAYLSDFSGRFLAGISVTKESIIQIQNLIAGFTNQINSLRTETNTLTTEKNNLNLERLRNQLQQLLANLRAAYTRFNQCSSGSVDYEKQLTQLRQDIVVIERKVLQINAQLEGYLKQMRGIDA